MTQFYAYVPDSRGEEPCGGTNKVIIKDLKTARGALNRCLKAFKEKPFRLYTFTNFYNEDTFTLIYRRDV